MGDPRRLVVVPYYSRAFGDEFAVIPESKLDEHGFQDATSIFAHLAPDALGPSRVTRFKTQEEAERYKNNVEAGR